MKKNIIFFAFFASKIFAQEADIELKIIYDVVNIYKTDALKKLGKEITVEIIEDEDENAYSYYKSVKIKFNRGYLNFLKGNEVLRTTCHEIGHLLGDNSSYHYDDLSATEGEADYFSGFCMVKYFEQIEKLTKIKATKKAVLLAKRQLQRIYENEVFTPVLAYNTPLEKGTVLIEHPTPNCRLLTVLHGIHQMSRPKCWYNP